MECELWKLLYWLVIKLDSPWGRWRYSTAEILAVYFWAVVHDRPTSWAADPAQWPDDLRPAWLPPQCTLSRRLRRPEVIELMTAVEQHLVSLLALSQYWVYMIDAKGLPVSGVSKDPDIGNGRCAGGFQKGYKFYAIWGRGPIPLAWEVSTMNVSEKTMARSLIPKLRGGGYLLGDPEYDANPLYDLAAESGFQLVTKKKRDRGRGGLGHRRQSPSRLRSIELMNKEFGRKLYKQRNAIESRFGTLTCTGGGLAPLPAWVRRFHRVRHWIHAKILAAAIRWIVIHEPHKLVNA